MMAYFCALVEGDIKTSMVACALIDVLESILAITPPGECVPYRNSISKRAASFVVTDWGNPLPKVNDHSRD